MRFLHTADWHLGRLFHGVHLTDDQAYLLDRFVDLVRDCRPDFILIAGDVYDRALPPPEAVVLLDDVLCRLVLDLHVPVIAIAGNHDSPRRLQFGSRLLAGQGMHMSGVLTAGAAPLVLRDEHGPVCVCALPYAEPAVVRDCLQCDGIHGHDEAMRACVGHLRERMPPGRCILTAHAFVAGGRECESERPLSVGGSAAVDAACFEGFHYVALGHLHLPHSVHRAHLCYAGSLMKYSFSEADHEKSVCLVEMDGRGACRLERIPLRPRRDLRRVRGHLEKLLDPSGSNEGRDDYLEITLLDEGALYDAMGRLRRVYPNVLHVQRAVLSEAGAIEDGGRDHRRIGERELFASFYRQMTGSTLTGDQDGAFRAAAERVALRQREALP